MHNDISLQNCLKRNKIDRHQARDGHSGPKILLQVCVYEFSRKFVFLYLSRGPATHSILLVKIYAYPTKSCGIHFQSGEAYDFEPII